MEQRCAVDGCEKSAEKRGMCNMHYRRVLRNGDPHTVKYPGLLGPRRCAVDECERAYLRNGLCAMHWGRLLRNGDPLATRRLPNGVHTMCTVDECGRTDVAAFGLCVKHYTRLSKYGSVNVVKCDRRPIDEQLNTRYEVVDSHWLWTGPIMANGYGKVKNVLAHRASYELHVGPIPEGLEIDHLCRVRNCINPEHLEPVTGAENMRRVALYNASVRATA